MMIAIATEVVAFAGVDVVGALFAEVAGHNSKNKLLIYYTSI